jgi:hypothetical protein
MVLQEHMGQVVMQTPAPVVKAAQVAPVAQAAPVALEVQAAHHNQAAQAALVVQEVADNQVVQAEQDKRAVFLSKQTQFQVLKFY